MSYLPQSNIFPPIHFDDRWSWTEFGRGGGWGRWCWSISQLTSSGGLTAFYFLTNRKIKVNQHRLFGKDSVKCVLPRDLWMCHDSVSVSLHQVAEVFRSFQLPTCYPSLSTDYSRTSKPTTDCCLIRLSQAIVHVHCSRRCRFCSVFLVPCLLLPLSL